MLISPQVVTMYVINIGANLILQSPKPGLSQKSQAACRDRIHTVLGSLHSIVLDSQKEIKGSQGLMSNGNSWVRFVLNTIENLSKAEDLTLSMSIEKDVMGMIERGVALINTVRKKVYDEITIVDSHDRPKSFKRLNLLTQLLLPSFHLMNHSSLLSSFKHTQILKKSLVSLTISNIASRNCGNRKHLKRKEKISMQTKKILPLLMFL